MKILYSALISACFFLPGTNTAQNTGDSQKKDRKFWLEYLDKVARPVILNLSEDNLKAKMPVSLAENSDNAVNRTKVSYLEAFGRTLNGIAPWLNLEGGSREEVMLRNQYREWSLKAIKNAVDTSANDYLKWTGGQPLVDASFFAQALIRCPWLWEHLDKSTQNQVVTAFRLTRQITPSYSNWILFSAMIETFFCRYGFDFDQLRIEYGVREFMQHWYTGDGMFSDGMNFHLDYYNSYVIQPYLNGIFEVMSGGNNSYAAFITRFDQIRKRYAEIQERMINSDGSFPATGRSIVYRGAAFHLLADLALRKQLPPSMTPSQVRGALTAVIKKTLEAPSTFTNDGWLNLGLCGRQVGLADYYINTGSLYLCSQIFLPLGLPETDEFWSSPSQPWTAVKIWSGQPANADHALDLK